MTEAIGRENRQVTRQRGHPVAGRRRQAGR